MYEYKGDGKAVDKNVRIAMRPVSSEWEFIQLDKLSDRIEAYAAAASDDLHYLAGMRKWQQGYAFALICTEVAENLPFAFVPKTADAETLAQNLRQWLALPRPIFLAWNKLIDQVIKEYIEPPKA